MFDISNSEEDIQKMKYNYMEMDEFSEKELLSMEKEMLGIYISGHPLEKYRKQLDEVTNFNTAQIEETIEQMTAGEKCDLQDGQSVKLAGVITKIKKKFTKSNKVMAFVTIEDLYGSCELIVFESCYNKCSNLLIEESLILCEGRISIRDENDITIIANQITELKSNSQRRLVIDITDLPEETKEKLRGTIKFFEGEQNNLKVNVKTNGKETECGAIFADNAGKTIEAFKDVVGEDRVELAVTE